MGYMSNQWLNRGLGYRNRSYSPVPVEVSCRKRSGSWSQSNQIKAEFTARRHNHEYQTLHVTEAECDAVAETIVNGMSQIGREQLLTELLRKLSHAKLLRVLAIDLNKRIRLPKDRQQRRR